jgi:hypothetical protein
VGNARVLVGVVQAGQKWRMQFSRARFLSSDFTTTQGASPVLVWKNMACLAEV